MANQKCVSRSTESAFAVSKQYPWNRGSISDASGSNVQCLITVGGGKGCKVQVVRRLFLLVGTSAFVATGEGSGGLDIAVGPNVGCSPLGLLGPAALLQGLLAGPGTEDPRRTPAALPLVGC